MMKRLAQLKLRTKILLAILLAWGFMLIFSYGISLTLEENYAELENKLAQDEIHRAEDAIKNINNALAIQAANWAVWDDAYNYIQGKNDGFAEKNLTVPGLAPVSTVDGLIIFNKLAKPIYSIALNADRTAETSFFPGVTTLFAPDTVLGKKLIQPNLNQVIKGLMYTPEGILLLATHSIVKSDGSGPAVGTWLMIQQLNQDVLQKLMNTTKLKIKLIPVAHIKNSDSLQKIYKKILDSDMIEITKVNNTLETYDVIKDVNGQPLAIINVTLPRNVYNTGMQTINYFNIVLFLAGLVFALSLFFMLKRLVINRLGRINSQVKNIQKTNDFSTVISVEGADELSTVSLAVNKTLNLIHEYDKENKQFLDAITYELNESNQLTTQLQTTKTFLSDLINSMPSMLLIVDKKLQLVQINNQAEKELCQTSEALKGNSLTDVFPVLLDKIDTIKLAFETQMVQNIDKILDNSKGQCRYLNIIIFPLSQNDLISIRIDDVTHWTKLQETMLQNDKMASIGVLTAGVAHEINNPINFVLSATSPLRTDLNDIANLIRKYAILPQSNNLTKDYAELKSLEEEVDLSYLLQEITQLLNGMQDGVSRTATIINDLQYVSQNEMHIVQKINIHESIDSSLTLLIHRYKDRVKIIKEYNDIPLIDGYAGHLNQVFMNIIANACDAIPDKGNLHIKTAVKDANNIVVSFKDNGVGIATEMLNKIFDPFYTTKDVGKGTGLGLSITRTIIEEIEGSIEVRSRLGEGSEFIITLPIHSNS